MAEYRPIPDDREDEFHRLLTEVFGVQEGPSEPPPPEERKTYGEPRGMFDGEDLASACRHYFWPVRVRGEWVDGSGLSAVATPPEHRRRGLVREMLAESVREYRDRGAVLSVLYPFERSFYAAYGWATACRSATLEAPVEAIGFAADARECELRRVEADEAARIHPAYAEQARGYTLAVDRPDEWWRETIFESYGTDPFVYAVESGDRVRGHLAYVVDDADDGRRLRVTDWSWTDRETWRNLLRFLADHDSQVGDVRLYGHPSELRDLLDLVDDPSAVEFRMSTGAMARVVDVAAALEAVPYPGGVDRRLTLSVSDPLVEFDDGRFVLDVSGGDGTCRRVDEADGVDAEGTTADPDLHLGVGALSQAVVGYRPVAALARVSGVEPRTEGALDDLAALFPPTRTFLREGF